MFVNKFQAFVVQVLWVVAYLAGLQRLELRTGPSETAQSKVGKLAAHTPSVIY